MEGEAEFASGQVDVLQGAGRVAMTGKARNRVQVAAGAGKVRQAEMAERMRAEGRNTGTQRDRPHHLRPRPQADGFRSVPARFREKQRSTSMGEAAAVDQIGLEQCPGRCRVGNHALSPRLGRLRTYADSAMSGV